MSIEPGPAPGPTPGRAWRDGRWAPSPAVRLRREGFGGLAYRYRDRRLFFIHAPDVVELVLALDGERPVGELLDQTFQRRRGRRPRPEEQETVARGLDRLLALDVVRAPSGDPLAAPTARARIQDARGERSVTESKEVFRRGLRAPICLTWELTYGCNLRCAHCLSSSDVERPGELDTAQAKALIDELAEMGVFYVNVGGGEPMSRPDFRELMDHCMDAGVGVKFSTNGTLLDDASADWISARREMLDVQISVDGARPETSDPLRGRGSFRRARQAMRRLADRRFPFKINAVATRANVDEVDALHTLAVDHGATLRLTRLRPSGRGRAVWEAMRPTRAQNRFLYGWLQDHPEVLTGDSFFHLSAYGAPLDGLNLCGAGRIVCCIDPLGDVYACPFVLDPAFAAGKVSGDGGFRRLWETSPLFAGLREWQVGGSCQSCNAYASCHGGCMAVKHATGRSLESPDPDCVFGHGEEATAGADAASGPRRRLPLPLAPATPGPG